MFNLANTLVVFQFELSPFTLFALPGVGSYLPQIHSHRKKKLFIGCEG